MPAITFSRVLFPDPLCPINARDSPSVTESDTSSRAQKSSARTRPASRRCFSDDGFSLYIRKRFETPSTSIAGVAELTAPPRSRPTC